MKKKNRISIQLQIMDFTIQTYIKLLETLQQQGFVFQTFEEYLQNPAEGKSIILRHDVDRMPLNALTMAKAESKFGISRDKIISVYKKAKEYQRNKIYSYYFFL